MYSGSCLCGDIAFAVDGPIQHIDQCHCSMCRKTHGAAFATYGGAGPEDFRMLRGEGLARRYRSSAKGSRLFCPRCGSVVPAKIADKPVAIALGNITEDPVARPKAHFFVGSKAPWHDIVDDLPQFEDYPPAFGFDASKTGPPARTAPTPGATGGSCLCGAVAFEFTGTPLGMTNCHCRDCRRAMSAAFATTVAVERDLCRWLSGERDVVRYTSSRSPHATSAFCGICGSPVPRSGRPGRLEIPAGCLDDDPGIRPTANLCVSEKAGWAVLDVGLPSFDTVRDQ